MEGADNNSQEGVGNGTNNLTFCSIVKVEKEEKCEYEEQELLYDSVDFPFVHFLDCSRPEGSADEVANTINEGSSNQSFDVKEEVNDYNDETTNYWPTLLGKYMKSEPQSDNDSDLDAGTSSIDSENSSDLDWNLEHKKLARKRKCNERPVACVQKKKPVNIKKIHWAPVMRQVDKKDSDRVQNAFKMITDSLNLGERKNKNQIQKMSIMGRQNNTNPRISKYFKTTAATNKSKNQSITPSTDSCPPNLTITSILSLASSNTKSSLANIPAKKNKTVKVVSLDNRSKLPKISKSINHRRVKCIFCSQVFTVDRLKKHLLNYFKQFQCSVCLFTSYQRKTCVTHAKKSPKCSKADVLVGSFLVSKDSTNNLKQCSNRKNNDKSVDAFNHYYQCSQCETLMTTEYQLINHYRKVHQNIYNNNVTLENPLSTRSIMKMKKKSSWSVKLKLKECSINLTRMNENEIVEKPENLKKGQLSNQFLTIYSRVIRSGERKNVNLTCGFCLKTYTTRQGYNLHLIRIHKQTPSSSSAMHSAATSTPPPCHSIKLFPAEDKEDSVKLQLDNSSAAGFWPLLGHEVKMEVV